MPSGYTHHSSFLEIAQILAEGYIRHRRNDQEGPLTNTQLDQQSDLQFDLQPNLRRHTPCGPLDLFSEIPLDHVSHRGNVRTTENRTSEKGASRE